MATTRIIPMHLNKGKTLARCLSDRTDHTMNPDKSNGGELISSYACDPATANAAYCSVLMTVLRAQPQASAIRVLLIPRLCSRRISL